MKFYKYQGTGNDFILIDNRNLQFFKDTKLINHLCDRRFGIGADGLILLEKDDHTDFRMVYYNADGNESTMCGNGGRCIIHFAHFLGIIKNSTKFVAIDGLHEGKIENSLVVKLKMGDVQAISNEADYSVLNTGSPHFVRFVKDVENIDVFAEGRKIRNSEKFVKEGINVNFVEQTSDNSLFIRTYERGVEDETYSCGTGATAAALTFMQNHHQKEVDIKVLGGNLKVYAELKDHGFINVWLEGPAQQVFTGTIDK